MGIAPAAPVVAPTVAPRSAPIAPVAPVTRSNNGRRVKVVRRRRPQQQSVAQETQRSAVLETLNDRNNQYDPRVNKQFQRKQQAGSERSQGVSKPIINRRLQIRPAAQPAQPAQSAHAQALRDHQAQLQQIQQQQFQQNNFGPVSAPAQQAQAPSQFVASAGSASNINLNTGTYSISYRDLTNFFSTNTKSKFFILQ